MTVILIISICVLVINTIIVYLQKLLIPDVENKWENGKQIQVGKYRSWYFSLWYLSKDVLLFIHPLPFSFSLFELILDYDTGSFKITILNTTLYWGNIKFKWWLNDNYNAGEDKPLLEKNVKS